MEKARSAVQCGRGASSEGGLPFARLGRLGYQALQEEGLVNEDEWSQILKNEAFGMPRYLTVMYWVEVRYSPLRMPCFWHAAQDGVQTGLSSACGMATFAGLCNACSSRCCHDTSQTGARFAQLLCKRRQLTTPWLCCRRCCTSARQQSTSQRGRCCRAC